MSKHRKMEEPVAPPPPAPEPVGIECPRCGCRHFEVLKTFRYPKGIRRRKECRHCGRRVNTYETL